MTTRNTPKIASKLSKSILSTTTPTDSPAVASRNSAKKTTASLASSAQVTSSLDLRHLHDASSIPKPMASKSLFGSAVKSKSTTQLNAYQTPTSLYRSCGTTSSSSKHKSLPTTPKSLVAKRLASMESRNTTTPECFSKVSIETPRRPLLTRTADNLHSGKDHSEISNLTVAVRVRPMNRKECTLPSMLNIINVDNNEVTVLAGTSADCSAGVSHSFQYDQAYWCCNSKHENYADQQSVFRGTALPLINNAFDGYNACLFAYGQTGSGKSYSMMGIDADDNVIGPDSEAGIIPRVCQELFARIEMLKQNGIRVEVEVSYFEIYNEKIHDLLAVSNVVAGTSSAVLQTAGTRKAALRVREHPTWGPYVVDLSTHPVDSHTALRNWLAVGNSQRATAATGMNDKSSRSHSIFNIVLNIANIMSSSSSLSSDSSLSASGDGNCGDVGQTKRSKISLVDLAGSERVSHTCASGERLREGVSINKSLLTLGKVIAALADAKKTSAGFVPYRESVLTWLLRENLGGNSRTVMLATISPASIHIDETLATLRYACQARTIVNRVKVNEDPHDREIRELRAEVERLHVLQQDYERQKRHSLTAAAPPRTIIIETSVDDSEVDALRQQLSQTEQELQQAQRSWRDRLEEAETIRKTEMKMLQRNGLALEISAAQKQPCLVNLAADPMLSGTLLYLLPLGTVKIGRSRPTAFDQPDIVLDGPLVAFNHCSIENRRGDLYLTPLSNEFDTFVNGEVLGECKQIFNGDRLVIGGSHYFRVNNPHCSNRSSKTVDYQLAHQEILRQQENRIREQLDAEKAAALRQIEEERVANEQQFSQKMATLEMDKFRYKCSKEILDTEKKALEQQMKPEPAFEYRPYQSNLLDEIKRIMQHPSDECLHQTQLKVKEATQRCRDLGIDCLDFRQTQISDEFGMFKAVINIVDRDRCLIAEWPPARLDVWLEIIRDNDDVTAETLFNSVDIEWQHNHEDDGSSDAANTTVGDANDSLNSSRISLNLNAVKEAILGKSAENGFKTIRKMLNSPFSPSKKPDMLRSAIINNDVIKKRLQYEDDESRAAKKPDKSARTSPGLTTAAVQMRQRRFEMSAQSYLKEIRKNIIKFKTLCQEYNSDENRIADRLIEEPNDMPIAKRLLQSLEQIENLTIDIKNTLSTNQNETSARTPKSVRFLLD